MTAVAIATPRRPRLFIVAPPRRQRDQPTRKELREARIAELKALVESMGIGWGGVAKGGLVMIYWPGADLPHVIRGVPVVERWMRQCKRWFYDDPNNDWAWFDWSVAVCSHGDHSETYRRLRAERAARG